METSANVMSRRNRRRERESEYLQNRCNFRRVVMINGSTVTDSFELSGPEMQRYMTLYTACIRRVCQARKWGSGLMAWEPDFSDS